MKNISICVFFYINVSSLLEEKWPHSTPTTADDQTTCFYFLSNHFSKKLFIFPKKHIPHIVQSVFLQKLWRILCLWKIAAILFWLALSVVYHRRLYLRANKQFLASTRWDTNRVWAVCRPVPPTSKSCTRQSSTQPFNQLTLCLLNLLFVKWNNSLSGPIVIISLLRCVSASVIVVCQLITEPSVVIIVSLSL